MMTSKAVVYFALCAGLLFIPSAPLSAQSRETHKPVSARILRQWGKETQDAITRDFWLPQRKLFADNAKDGQTANRQPAFMWGVGVQLTGLISAAHHDRKQYGELLRTYADAIEVYWATHDGIAGYDVLPHPKPIDRYYDDNVWLALAFAEASEVIGEPKYLGKAEDIFRFVLSGQDNTLGGGIYWRENEKTSKNTCINAPAIAAALRLYQLTRKPSYLETAYRLYHWTCSRLQDKDGLFWDNIQINGKIDTTKFSYNSALMIRANTLFYEVTGQKSYLTEAQRIAQAAEARWIRAETGAMDDTGRFAHLLLESLLELSEQDGDTRRVRLVEKVLAFLHDRVRDPKGRYPERWDKPQTEPLAEFALIDQASAARAYWKAAEKETSR
jgi:rhamnogalacturonyl hydrolase YesR